MSIICYTSGGYAAIAQLVEHVHGKDGVLGSNPSRGSTNGKISELRRKSAVFSLVCAPRRHYVPAMNNALTLANGWQHIINRLVAQEFSYAAQDARQ
jgi:hypothetical protein